MTMKINKWDISLCKNCHCMTHTVKKEGKYVCGKCKHEKNE